MRLLEAGSICFITDCSNGYWKTGQLEAYRARTTLFSSHQLFGFVSMPFRVQTALLFFKGAVEAILAPF